MVFRPQYSGADDRAAVVLEDLAEVLDEPLGLRVGEILTRDEDMLVESHAGFPFAARFKTGRCGPSGPGTRGCA